MATRGIPDSFLAHALPPGWISEHRFHPTRRWRFDYAWPEYMIALEVEGGAFVRGRHTRGAGFRNDIEKYNEATLAGWHVLRIIRDDWNAGGAVRLIEKAIEKLVPMHKQE